MPFLLPFIPAIATVGAAVIGANAASSSQDKAISAQNTSTAQSLAAQKAALDRITGLQQPFIDAGASVLPGIGARVASGAPNFSSPNYARPQPSAYPAPQPAAGAPPHVGAVGVPDGSMGTGKLGNGISIDPASVGPSGVPQPAADGAPPVAAGPNWDAYLAANPDLAREAQRVTADGEFPNVQAYLSWHDQHYPQEGRPSPATAPPNAGAPTPQGPTAPTTLAAPAQPLNLGTASPVVADYTRPDQGTSPSINQFIDPSQFKTSPGYQFRLDQGLRNTNAQFGAKGLLQSGAALQGFNDYAQNSASQEYQNWFNRQQQQYQDAANQFNTDRNNTNQNYTEDRSYGTNLAVNNRDFANQQYNTQTQNMFQLAGIGANAAGAVGSAVSGNANNSSNIFANQGANIANNALAQGQTQAGLAGTVGSTVANLFGNTNYGSRPLNVQTSGGYGGNLTPQPFAQAASGSLNSTPLQWTPY